MRKFIYIICMLSLIVIISGCGKDEPEDPNDVLASYISKWSEKDFTAMYKMLTNDAKDTYDDDDFIERYEKLYSDLEIKDIKVKPSTLTEKEQKQVKEDKSANFSLQISMDSLAGEIAFEREIDLHLTEYDEKDKQDQWLIDWDEGLIFPGLENGGKVSIEKEAPRRGEILDRNQMPLAINDTAYEVGIVPGQMEDKSNEISEMARILSLSEEKIEDKLNESWVQDDYFVPLKTIPQSSEEQLNELSNIPGMSTQETKGRSYPSGEASAHLTGFIGTITKEELEEYPEGTYSEGDLIGKRGLEELYEEKLRGKGGVKILVVTEEDGEKEEEVLAETPVEDGKNIQLSIDVNTQEKIFNSYGKKAGTSTAIDPKTGEVLALVSSPSFDPNEFIYGISQSKWEELSDDANQPLLNRFASTYAPGSAIKPITAAIGLKNGSITHDEGIEINGKEWGKKGWGDVVVTRVSTTDKPVDLKLALTNSDNIYFAMKAVEMGSDDYIEGMKKFGFDDKLPIKYPIKKSQISNDGKMDEILLANTSYGQGQVEMSALHLAFAYTPFLNDGNMIKPSFLEKDKTGEIWEKEILSKEDANKMKDYLQAVVKEGTASKAKDKKLPISGKTGTAELKASKDSEGDQNGWFVGYPTDDENILIAMMIEDVEDDGGSNYVAGKVKDVMKKIKKAEDQN